MTGVQTCALPIFLLHASGRKIAPFYALRHAGESAGGQILLQTEAIENIAKATASSSVFRFSVNQ